MGTPLTLDGSKRMSSCVYCPLIAGGDMRCLKIGQTGVCHCLLMVLVSLSSMVANAQQESTNMQDPRTREAVALMMNFAERSGLDSGQAGRRYLWTDAFAVCNFPGLARITATSMK